MEATFIGTTLDAIIVALAGALVTILISASRSLIKSFKRHKKEHKHIQDNLDEVRENFKTARKRELTKDFLHFERQGYVTTLELEVWLNGFDNYVKLGGNSYMQDLKERIQDLELR